MIDLGLIDKYIKELDFVLFTYEAGKVKRITTSTVIQKYIADSSDLENFDSKRTLLGLDLEKSGLTCIWIDLLDIIGIFSSTNDCKEQEKIIELFSYSAPVYFDTEIQKFYILFKRFSEKKEIYNHFGLVASIQDGYINIPFRSDLSLNERSSWLFPERSIDKLKPCNIKPSREIIDYKLKTLDIDTNNICTDNPLAYYSLLSKLPMQIKRLLRV